MSANVLTLEDAEKLLPVIGKDLFAGLAELGAVFLEARQNDQIIIIDVGAAKT